MRQDHTHLWVLEHIDSNMADVTGAPGVSQMRCQCGEILSSDEIERRINLFEVRFGDTDD